MLDLLARVPGTSAESKRYQTETSHDFQVVFTSYGAHWHVLVGKHPRLPEQHAGVKGMSNDIAVRHRDQASQNPILIASFTAALKEDLERLHRDPTRRVGTTSTRRSDPQMGSDHISGLCDTTPKGVA